MKHFAYEELLCEVSRMIAGYQEVARLFAPHEAQDMRLGETVTAANAIKVSPGEVAALPVGWRLRKAYDYVFTGRWDCMGGMYSVEQVYINLKGFADMMHVAMVDLARTEPVLLDKLLAAMHGRWKLDETDMPLIDPLTLSEAALLTGMTEQAIRNAASRGAFRLELTDDPQLVMGDDETLRREQFLLGEHVFEWVRQRQGFLRLPEGVPAFYDSLDELDPRTFSTYGELGAFLRERLAARGVDSQAFARRVGRPLEDFQDLSRLKVFRLPEWRAIAKLADLNPLWLCARCFHTLHPLDDLDWEYELETFALLERLEREAARRKAKEEVFLVPVAADGTCFTPDLKRSKGYQIGRRGQDQRYVDNYFEALEALRKMNTPYWRRPSATSGIMGTVKGVSWREIPKRELFKVHTNDKKGG